MAIKNPFETLRIPGVRGSVATNFNVQTVLERGAQEVLQIRTARICDDAWAFGFYLKSGDITRQMLPGEGSGWFKSEDDAKLYALGYIRYGNIYITSDMKMCIDVAISDIQNVSLFGDTI